MKQSNNKKCNKECLGTIKELKIKGLDYPTKITVEYIVDGKTYILKENLIMKPYKKNYLWFIPIGYKTKSLIELRTGAKAVVGNSVKVKYEDSDPNNAYLVDNVGKVTWD